MRKIFLFIFLAATVAACNKSKDPVTVSFPSQYPELPVYHQPADSSHFFVGGVVTFEWKACKDPQGDPVVYDLYIDGNNPYTGLTDNKVLVTVNNYYFTGWLSWRVVARDNHGNYTEGPYRMFTINY